MKPGDELGPYTLVESLGRGGFSEVWRAKLQPSRACNLSAEAQRHFLQVVASVLEERAPPRSKVLRNLLDNLTILTTTQESAGVGAPESVLEANRDLIDRVLAWVDMDGETILEDVALKVPFHDGYVRQLRREKDVLKRVSHPNLVRQYAVDVTHDPPYLAMELVEGWSLRHALKSEPIPPMKKILAVMDQLLTVLGHLHRRGFVHGDVKPENVVMQPDGTLRLIDLGLGQVSQAVMRDVYLSLSLASRVPLLGTLSYMAPEVRQGQPASASSDLYSAGIMLYEMLVGDVPTGMALPSEAAPERELTERFDILLKWVLNPDPKRRVGSAEELRERVLITMRPRARHKLGRKGTARAKARDGTVEIGKWALRHARPFVQGDWLGEYQLGEPVGRGGFGEVWRARRGPTAENPVGEQVALKIAIGPHGKVALAKEADVAGRLDHPLIPKVHTAHLDHDPPFLAVDFVEGVSLRGRLTEFGPLDADEAVPMMLSLVGALAHCHSRGVLHQDLKPENLVWNERKDTLYLLDFGLASTGDAQLQATEVSGGLVSQQADGGTFEYMAPERRRGGESTAAADVYSLGVVFFEMLTGQLPRGLTRLRELCGAPRSLEALIERLLHADATRRPSLTEMEASLGAEKPRRRLFTGRRKRVTQAAPVPLVAAVGVASLPFVLGLILGGAGDHEIAAAIACAVGSAALTGVAFWPRLRNAWGMERITAVHVAALAALVAAMLFARPHLHGAEAPLMQEVAHAVSETLDLEARGTVASLRKRVRVKRIDLDGFVQMAAGLSSAERAELDARIRPASLYLQRLGAWAGTRDRVAASAGQAMPGGATRRSLEALVARDAPEPLTDPSAFGRWHLEIRRNLEGLVEQLDAALSADPLSNDAWSWRLERRRLVARRDRHANQVLAAAGRGVGESPESLRLVLATERLLPRRSEITRLYAGLADPAAGIISRAELAHDLIARDRLEDAQAVGERLGAETPEASKAWGEIRVALEEAEADRARAQTLRASARAETNRVAIGLLMEATKLAPNDDDLARSLAVRQARIALADETLRWAQEKLWSEVVPSPALEGWAEAALLSKRTSVAVVRLGLVVRALLGRFEEADELRDWLPAGARHRGVLGHLNTYRAARLARDTFLRSLDPTTLSARQSGLLNAELALEKAGVALRQAALGS